MGKNISSLRLSSSPLPLKTPQSSRVKAQTGRPEVVEQRIVKDTLSKRPNVTGSSFWSTLQMTNAPKFPGDQTELMVADESQAGGPQVPRQSEASNLWTRFGAKNTPNPFPTMQQKTISQSNVIDGAMPIGQTSNQFSIGGSLTVTDPRAKNEPTPGDRSSIVPFGSSSSGRNQQLSSPQQHDLSRKRHSHVTAMPVKRQDNAHESLKKYLLGKTQDSLVTQQFRRTHPFIAGAANNKRRIAAQPFPNAAPIGGM